MSNVFEEVIGKNTGKTKEDELFEKTTIDTDCPYGICNGSGIIPSELDPRDATFCKCYKERVFSQKLKNSNINQKYLHLDFDDFDEETKVYLFKPKKKPDEFKPSARIKTVLDENPNNFVKRNYTKKLQKRSLQELLKSYCDKNIDILNTKNGKTANLLLFGDSGNGKTTFAILAGKYFLKKGKKVFFSTSQEMIDYFINKEKDPMHIAKTVDVLILDELFNEYHTDTQFAKKKLKEILKVREELGLITICTSNGNPKDFTLLYGESIMSLINGTFFLFYLERETDGRVEEMHDLYKDFDL